MSTSHVCYNTEEKDLDNDSANINIAISQLHIRFPIARFLSSLYGKYLVINMDRDGTGQAA